MFIRQQKENLGKKNSHSFFQFFNLKKTTHWLFAGNKKGQTMTTIPHFQNREKTGTSKGLWERLDGWTSRRRISEYFRHYLSYISR